MYGCSKAGTQGTLQSNSRLRHLLAEAFARDEVDGRIDEGVERQSLEQQSAIHGHLVEVHRRIPDHCACMQHLSQPLHVCAAKIRHRMHCRCQPLRTCNGKVG